MADNPQTLSGILTALAQTFPGEVHRQINRMSVALAVSKIVSGGGKNVPWDIEGSGAIAENHTEDQTVTSFGNDAVKPATLDWGLYRSNFRITDLAAAAAATSQSPQQLRDLVGRAMDNACAATASAINSDFYAGAGTGTLLAGLEMAIEDSNTYAGIVRGADTFFQSTVVDPGALTPLSFGQVRSDLAAIYKKSGRRPDFALVSPEVLNEAKALYDTNRRWEMELQTAGRGKVVLENSSGVVDVEGCKFVEDKDCTANAIYYMNSAEYEIETLATAMNFGDPRQASDGFNALMLGLSVYELGRTGPSRMFSLGAKLQLKLMRPNAFGKRLNVKTA